MRLYYSEYKYNSLEPGNAESSRRLADFLFRLIEGIEGVERLCDLGCGNGYLAGRLAANGYNVTGIDASASGIELAHNAYVSDRIEFICAAIERSLHEVLVNDKFDLIISSEVIEHMYRPSDLLETAAQLLKPQGHLISTAPYHGYLKNLALSILNKWDNHHTVEWDGGHIKFFSVRTLRSLIAKHSFEDIRFSFYGRFPGLWKNKICHAYKRI
jgi:2-polyprenyl-3-methyl-5-hydroxy-6-metoxy-1,4-benzoquinol methylase